MKLNVKTLCTICWLIIPTCLGVICLYFGTKCRTQELRKLDNACSVLENDASAIAVLILGVILVIPVLGFVCFCCSKICYEDNTVREFDYNEEENSCLTFSRY